MPELRRDPVVGYWTIISEERGWRPMDYRPKKASDERECPFCEGKESQTPAEIEAWRKPGTQPNGPGWEVRVIPSKIPILGGGPDEEHSHGLGLYDYRGASGKHEIIIETPQHRHDLDEFPQESVQKVVEIYVRRIRQLSKDPRFAYAVLFKNHGLVSGVATDVIRHSRSQLIALPIIPKRTKEQLALSKSYYERRGRCVFCDILKQELSDGKRLVAENNEFYAFCPFASRSPFEIWVAPKKHLADFGAMADSGTPAMGWILRECLYKLHALLDDPPFNMILHNAPFRHDKSAEHWRTLADDTHWYFQIMPRLTQSAGFEWGTGIHINPTPPEEAARLLRETETDASTA